MRHHIRLRQLALATVLIAASACDDFGTIPVINVEPGDATRHVTARVGQGVTITLQTTGPGSYVSPPSISSPSVLFLGLGPVDFQPPGGPRQSFLFQARAVGEAVISFTHTGTNPQLQYTIKVQ